MNSTNPLAGNRLFRECLRDMPFILGV
jgi:hypothetical protein